MITEGCLVKSEAIRGTVGAIIRVQTSSACRDYCRSRYPLTVAVAVGTKVVVDGYESTVIRLLNDYDLALIEVPPEHATLSTIGRASFGPAELVTYDRRITCRVI